MPETSDSVIRFEQVGLRYGTGPEVLRDISLDLEPGSFHFLTGASGAGKSSLLKLMYLGHRPTRGIVSVFGRPLGLMSREELPLMRRRIGVVFQDFRLLDHLSAFDNVALPLRIAGVAENVVQRNVTELLEWVKLGDYVKARPATLSGGQKQRVAIARAVINRPKILLADEPTGNVDDQIAVRLLYLFEQLNQFGTAIVIATHNEQITQRFRHQRLHLTDGSLVQLPAGITSPAAVAAAAGPGKTA